VKNKLAFTLIEVVVVLAIVAVLVAILTPVLLSARQQGKITDSVSKVRQLYLSVQIYRSDWQGTDDYAGGFYEAGLPPQNLGLPAIGLPASFYASPCGPDKTIHDTGPTLVDGYITYAAAFYDPAMLKHPQSAYKNYLKTYRQNAVLFVDPYCNPAGTDMRKPGIEKRGIAVLLSGKIENRFRRGRASTLEWYSDPPND
jgi:prepilin-type N-terminal cleavage/methylation domain-containing protein